MVMSRMQSSQPTTQPDEPVELAGQQPDGPIADSEPSGAVANPTAPAPGPEGMTRGLAEQIGPSPITTPTVDAAQARQAYRQGVKLYQANEQLLQARTLLNQAYRSGQLEPAQADRARQLLEDLAQRTVLKRDSYVNPKDPYTLSHTFAAGEKLLSDRKGGKVVKEGIIARLDLNVPAGVIVWVNGLNSSTEFRANRSYKMLKGPFHLVVDRSERAADLYLQDLFVKRMPVCVGAAETPTPLGYFRVVAWSGKTGNSTYYPPAATNRPNTPIYPGQAGYPLGPKGLNIKIEGIPQLGTTIRASQSYALHGTNEPASLGEAKSRGCLRFSDEDTQLIYDSLIDYGDPDDPRVTWSHWSTVTIRP
jgi:hypothetical protein